MTEILTDLSEPALQRAIIDNLLIYASRYGLVDGIELDSTPDLIRLFAPEIPNPFFNAVMSAPTATDEDIARYTAPFRERDLSAFWWTWSCRDDVSTERLRAADFFLLESQPGMAADLHALDETRTAPADFHIEPVTDDDGLRRYLGVTERMYGFPEPVMDAFYGCYRHSLTPDAPMQHFYGVLDDQPVAVVSVLLAAGVAGIYDVIVLPDYQRRGLGRAITLHPLQTARAAGYRVSVLNASAEGAPLYRVLGYREYCRVNMHMFTPGA